jgi:hypothetical protein
LTVSAILVLAVVGHLAFVVSLRCFTPLFFKMNSGGEPSAQSGATILSRERCNNEDRRMPLSRERCNFEDRTLPLSRERSYFEDRTLHLSRERCYIEDRTMPLSRERCYFEGRK